jgi:glycosyltransferase involved in cell wall biosynthesis
MKILHIMPHLGGGVGKALSTLVAQFTDKDYCHSFLLLELPEKSQFLDKIRELGCEVHVKPNNETVNALVNNTDIVQLEWWNHPATFQFLCTHDLPPMRLMVWCHISGLSVPIIPQKLIKASRYFLFTSACSYKAKSIISLDDINKLKLGVVSSGIGFKYSKTTKFKSQTKLRYGYMGSLNPGKIHPNFISYLYKVDISGFKVSIWGDNFYKDVLLDKCRDMSSVELVNFKGYSTNPQITLSSLDVFVYLLNPVHYGTAENVLLEAMSLGVVPVVMNNEAEMEIVRHGETGLIVSDENEFSDAINWLESNPKDREKMSKNAIIDIGKNYSTNKMFEDMSSYYERSIKYLKQEINFCDAFGNDPYDWYFVSQEHNDSVIKSHNNELNEITKGSLRHYLNYFPNNSRLKELVKI